MNQEYLEAPKPITAAHKQGLAKMYADENIRSYLIHAAQVANHNILACLKANKSDDAKNFSIRHTILTNLIEKAKSEYVSSEKVAREKK